MISASLTLASPASGPSSKYSAAAVRVAAISFSERGFCDAKSRASTTAFRVTMIRNPEFSIQYPADFDFGEWPVLKDLDLAHSDKLQQRQKSDRNFGATRSCLEKIEKRDRFFARNNPHDKVNFVRDGVAFLKNLTKIFAFLFDFLQHLLECVNQIEDSDFRFEQRARILELRLLRDPNDEPFLQ